MLRYCYISDAQYNFKFWLVVEGRSMAIDSFRKLAINIGFGEERVKEASEEEIVGWVRSWLENRSKWLLLLDNADDVVIKEIFPLLPRKGGHVILTTREFIPPTEAMTIHVGKMEKEEALSLLFSPTSLDLINQESIEFHNAQKIITELDCLPLATNLARAYINNMLMSFKEFLIG